MVDFYSKLIYVCHLKVISLRQRYVWEALKFFISLTVLTIHVSAVIFFILLKQEAIFPAINSGIPLKRTYTWFGYLGWQTLCNLERELSLKVQSQLCWYQKFLLFGIVCIYKFLSFQVSCSLYPFWFENIFLVSLMKDCICFCRISKHFVLCEYF